MTNAAINLSVDTTDIITLLNQILAAQTNLITQGIVLSGKLDSVLASLTALGELMSTADAALAALQAQVAQNTTIEGSAVTLINGIAAQLAALVAAGNQDPALAALASQLNTSASALSAAITANTPAPAQAPAPAPAPAPGP